VVDPEPDVEQHYFWNGPTVLQAGSVPAGGDATFAVTPCFISPGTYSLEHFQLVVTSAQLYPQPYTISPPRHLIHVTVPPLVA
jgi:hypothetical protein